jgi:formylmethanofuran dehydrogenase subunit E
MKGGWRPERPDRERKQRNGDTPHVDEESFRRFLEETGIKVVSDEEAEEVDAVVCNTADIPSYFDNNVDTVCADCGAAIYHRPHVPKKPKKICINCAVAMQEREDAEKAGEDDAQS